MHGTWRRSNLFIILALNYFNLKAKIKNKTLGIILWMKLDFPTCWQFFYFFTGHKPFFGSCDLSYTKKTNQQKTEPIIFIYIKSR